MTTSHTLINDALRLVVVPEAGGRITHLIDRRTDRDWLWKSGAQPQAWPLGEPYDDVWAGGFEELFPNDLAETLDGVALPDHGELWSQPWDLTVVSEHEVTLHCTGATTGTRVIKRLRLEGSEVEITYRLKNRGPDPFPFLFKLHPALAVTGEDELVLPGGEAARVDANFSTMLEEDGWMAWPTPARLDQCRDARSRHREFVYVRYLPQGWCGARAPDGRGIRIDYPNDILPYCWIFMTYGGWLDHQVVVLEPCTTHPKRLSAAIEAGTTPVLHSGEVLEFSIRVRLGSDWT